MAGPDAIINVGAVLAGQTQAAFRAVSTGFKSIAVAMGDVAKSMKNMGDGSGTAQLEKFTTAINKATAEIDKQSDEMSKLAGAYDKTEKEVKDFTSVLDKFNSAISSDETGKAADNLEVLYSKYHRLIDANTKLGTKARDTIEAMVPRVGTNTGFKVLSNQLSELYSDFKRLDPTAKEYNRALSQVDYQQNKLINSTDLYGRSATNLVKLYAKQGGDLAVLKNRLNSLSQLQKKASAEEDAREKAIRKTATATTDLSHQYRALLKTGTVYSSSAKQIIATLERTGGSAKTAKQKLQLLSDFQKTAAAQTKAAAAALQAAEEKKIKALLATDKSLKKLQGTYAELVTGTSYYTRAANNLILKFDKTKHSIDALEDSLKGLAMLHKEEAAAADAAARKTKAAEEAKAKATDRARSAYYSLQKTYNKLLLSQDKYGASARKVIENLRYLKKNTDQATQALTILTLRQKAAAAAMSPMASVIQTLNKRFKTYVGYVVASSAVFAVVQEVRSAVTAISTYDQALKDLQAITNATASDMEKMNAVIRQTASDTKFSAVETAEGAKILGQAGLSAAEATAAIPDVTELATGTLTDMQTTVDLVTTSMRVYGIQAKDTSRITDTFANAVNSSKLTVDKLRTAFNYVGPVAATVGMTIEDTAAALMTMANQGLRASTMGTSFRKIILELASPNQALANALAGVGKSIADLDVKTLGFNQVMRNLKDVVVGVTDASTFFGKRATTAILGLVRNVDSLDKMREVVERTGTASNMAAIQLSGLTLKFKNLQDKIKNIYIGMGDQGLLSVFTSLVDGARALADALEFLTNNAIAGTTGKVLLLLTAVKGLSLAFGWFARSSFVVAALQSIVSGVTTLRISMMSTSLAVDGLKMSLRGLYTLLVSNAFGIAAVAIGVLVTKLYNYQENLNLATIALRDQATEMEVNMSALSDYTTQLSNANIGDKERQEIVEALVELYPKYKTQIDNAKDSNEKLLEVIEALNEADSKRLRVVQTAELESKLKQLYIAYRKLDKLQTSSWAKATMTTAEYNLAVQQADDSVKDLTNRTAYLASALGDVSVKDLLAEATGIVGDSGVDLQEQLLGDVLQAIVDHQVDAYEAGKELGKATVAGVEQGLHVTDPKQFIKDQISAYKTAKKEIEAELAKDVYNIELEYVKLPSSKQDPDAHRKAILEENIEAYEALLAKAKEYQDQVGKTDNVEAVAKAGRERLTLQRKYDQYMLQQVEDSQKHKEKVEKAATSRYVKNQTDAYKVAKAKIAKDLASELLTVEKAFVSLSSAEQDETQHALAKTELRIAHYKEMLALAADYKSVMEDTAGQEAATLEQIALQKQFKQYELKQLKESQKQKEKVEKAAIAKQVSNYKTAKEKIEKDLAASTLTLEIDYATTAPEDQDRDAFDIKVIENTIEAYGKLLVEVKKYKREVSKTGDKEALAVAAREELSVQEQIAKYKLQQLKNFAKARKAASDKIVAQEKKQADEVLKVNARMDAKGKELLNNKVQAHKTYGDKIVEIEKDAATKRLEAVTAFNLKMKEAAKARIEIERKAASDIKSISGDIADKIFGIQTKGMSEAAKQVATLERANEKLSKGTSQLAAARRAGDSAAIDRAQELITKAGEYYGSLEDSGDAISGLKKVEKALISARKAEKKVELSELNTKVNNEVKAHRYKLSKIDRLEREALAKALSQFNTKMTAINSMYDAWAKKEKTRHLKFMANADAEIAKQRELVSVAAGKQDSIVTPTAAPVGGDSPQNAVDFTQPVAEATKKATATGTKEGVEEGVEKATPAVEKKVAKAVEGAAKKEIEARAKITIGPPSDGDIAPAVKKIEEFWIEEVDGLPAKLVIAPIADRDVNKLTEDIQAYLDSYPSDVKIDTTVANQQLKDWVRMASKSISVEVPVKLKNEGGQALHDGGPVHKMATGGRLPGTKSQKDKLPVLARPGEWFITDEVVTSWSRSVGDWFMQAVHKPASEAGVALKNVIQGASARPKTIPVASSTPSSGATDNLSSLSSFGTLNINIGGKSAQILATPTDAMMLARQFKTLEAASS